MIFTVERKTLIKMLKLLSLGGVPRDAHLRIAAQDKRLILTLEDYAGTEFEADVAEEGVCFFRQKQLLPFLRSYRGVKTLTIAVTSDGIKIGNSTIGRGLWHISLFENPAAAPQQLKMKPPKTAREVESEEQNMLDL